MHGHNERGKTGGWLGRSIDHRIQTLSVDNMISGGPPTPPPKDDKWLVAARKKVRFVDEDVTLSTEDGIQPLDEDVSLINLGDNTSTGVVMCSEFRVKDIMAPYPHISRCRSTKSLPQVPDEALLAEKIDRLRRKDSAKSLPEGIKERIPNRNHINRQISTKSLPESPAKPELPAKDITLKARQTKPRVKEITIHQNQHKDSKKALLDFKKNNPKVREVTIHQTSHKNSARSLPTVHVEDATLKDEYVKCTNCPKGRLEGRERNFNPKIAEIDQRIKELKQKVINLTPPKKKTMEAPELMHNHRHNHEETPYVWDVSNLPLHLLKHLYIPQVPAQGGGKPYRSLPPYLYGSNPSPVYWPKVLVMMARDGKKKESWFTNKHLGELHVTMKGPSNSYSEATVSAQIRQSIKVECNVVYHSMLVNDYCMSRWRYNFGKEKGRVMWKEIGDIFVQSMKELLYNLSSDQNFYVSWYQPMLLPHPKDITKRAPFYKPPMIMGEGIPTDQVGSYQGYAPHTAILIQPIEGDPNGITSGEFLTLLILAGDMYDDDLANEAHTAGFLKQKIYRTRVLTIHHMEARIVYATIPTEFLQKSVSHTRFPEWTSDSLYAFEVAKTPYISFYEIEGHRHLLELMIDTTHTRRDVVNKAVPVPAEKPSSALETDNGGDQETNDDSNGSTNDSDGENNVVNNVETALEAYDFNDSVSDSASIDFPDFDSTVEHSQTETHEKLNENPDIKKEEEAISPTPEVEFLSRPFLETIEEDPEEEYEEDEETTAEKMYEERFIKFFGASGL